MAVRICPGGHELHRSWCGTVGCREKGCPHERHPSEEIISTGLPSLGCGHPHYVGPNWRSGCRTEGCWNYLTGTDVTAEIRP